MPRTYQGNLSDIGILAQEEHQGFCFGISESHVVFENFGTILSYHETREQNTNEWEAYLTLGKSMQCVVGVFSPSFLMPSIVGCNASLKIRSMSAGVAMGAGA